MDGIIEKYVQVIILNEYVILKFVSSLDSSEERNISLTDYNLIKDRLRQRIIRYGDANDLDLANKMLSGEITINPFCKFSNSHVVTFTDNSKRKLLLNTHAYKKLLLKVRMEKPSKNAIIKELIEVLSWYGEQARLARLINSEGDKGRHNLANDGGKKARDIIEKYANYDK